jgi:hypothetical protein
MGFQPLRPRPGVGLTWLPWPNRAFISASLDVGPRRALPESAPARLRTGLEHRARWASVSPTRALRSRALRGGPRPTAPYLSAASFGPPLVVSVDERGSKIQTKPAAIPQASKAATK